MSKAVHAVCYLAISNDIMTACLTSARRYMFVCPEIRPQRSTASRRQPAVLSSTLSANCLEID